MKSRLERSKIMDGVALYHFLFICFWVKDNENKCGDDIIRRETFSFFKKCPLLHFLDFLQMGTWGVHFQWNFQVFRMCRGV